MRWMWFLLAGIGGLTGCEGPVDDSGGDTVAAGPIVDLLRPVEGDTVCGDPFALAVDVRNFELVGFELDEVREGFGHVDIFLNGQNRWMTYLTEFEIPHVDEGLFLVDALLVHENHLPIEPEVSDSVTVTVDASACSLE